MKRPAPWIEVAAALIATPFVALGLILAGVLILLAWPVSPFLYRYHKKNEAAKLHEQTTDNEAG